jgi:putative ABC transport system substrate-binding protein
MTRLLRVAVLILAVLAAAPGARAQTPKTPLVGVLMTNAYGARLDALRAGLRAAGYEEGRTITIVSRTGEGARLDALARELVSLRPDLVVGDTAPSTLALSRATRTIPIVFMATADPVGAGFVKSLAHPGGMITGLTEVTAHLTGKRLQLLREIRPGLTVVGVLANPEHAFHRAMMDDADKAARQIGVRLVPFEVRTLAEIEAAFGAMKRERVEAVLLMPHPLFGTNRAVISRLALQQRLPLSGGTVDAVKAGYLFTYAPDYIAQARRSATYVDKILKGAKPADLPVEQPTTFELTINLTTAKTLGLEIPQAVLLRADRTVQ